MRLKVVLARAAAFAFGVLASFVVVHAFGYQVVESPTPPQTATEARDAVRQNPQSHQWHVLKAMHQHKRAADWLRR